MTGNGRATMERPLPSTMVPVLLPDPSLEPALSTEENDEARDVEPVVFEKFGVIGEYDFRPTSESYDRMIEEAEVPKDSSALEPAEALSDPANPDEPAGAVTGTTPSESSSESSLEQDSSKKTSTSPGKSVPSAVEKI